MLIRPWHLCLSIAGLALLSACGVAAKPSAHKISGDVSGLKGSVTLSNSGVEALNLSANGPFAFQTMIKSGTAYQVSITKSPEGQNCEVSNGEGIIANSNITTVVVNCVSLTPGERLQSDNGTGALSVQP